MYQKIIEYAEALDKISRERRRDFHRYPETAWLEMRTSAVIAKVLTELGYEVLTGKDVCLESSRLGVPSSEELKEHAERALLQGAPAERGLYRCDWNSPVRRRACDSSPF